MSLTTAQLRQIGESFVAAFNNLSMSDFLAQRTPECIMLLAPASLNLPPTLDNEAFGNHVNHVLRVVLNHYPVTAKEMHINERGRQITIWGTGKPEFKEEAMGGEPAENWDFVGEYLFVLDVDGEGKIVRILEFLDSLATARLQGLVARAMENLGKKKGVVG